MAGVGFELKKLFKEKSGFVDSFRAYAISCIITQGPMLLCITLLFLFRYLIRSFGSSYMEQEVFLITITYIMIFSMILTNTMLFFISRFISDCIYQKKFENIMSAFYGLSALLVTVGGIAGYFYIFTMDIGIVYKVLSLSLFCMVMIVWVQLAFLSAIHKYTKILKGFFLAVVFALGSGFALLVIGAEPLIAALSGYAFGYFLMMVIFLQQMLKFYPPSKINLLIFFPALDQYKILIFVGFFMAIGLYGHNFVLWASSYGTSVLNRMRYSMIYDIPCFYACLTIIPMLVTFVVSLEVNFYKKYRVYFDTILQGGRLEDMRIAHKSMTTVLLRELSHMLETQLFFTIFAASFLAQLLQRIGLDINMTGIFRILCFGYCFYGLANSAIIILLYFDDRVGALVASLLFAASSIVGTLISLDLGIEYYGIGFFAGALITSIYALIRIYVYLRNLEYNVFCKQPLFYEEKTGVFTKIASRAMGK